MMGIPLINKSQVTNLTKPEPTLKRNVTLSAIMLLENLLQWVNL